ncbi:hypothetical protein PR202_ga21984 [Eleusine coracana subsp. coracana]|uniref:F-box domain-containing protein n=1 Tax=Eleusine coracana subsp. coracana TaxID=191504 RepID=A0AAV5D329_ELECO|nr:hypothetical protein PR202_ga21984 [Eleusine coracana subsp. coracana]
MAPAVAGADISPDWTHLPKDVLVTVLSELHIRDLIRAGAACAPWRSAYTAFRLLRLPSPRQPPCLLYYSGDTPNCAAALYCPSTGANFRIPFPQLGGLSPIGSAHGWLVVADEVGNLHLTNPLTSAAAHHNAARHRGRHHLRRGRQPRVQLPPKTGGPHPAGAHPGE